MLSSTLLVSLAIFGSSHYVSADVVGSIEATLNRETGKHGPALAAQTARLLGWKGDVARQVFRGDKLRLAYTIEDVPQLLALEYDGLKLDIEAYGFKDKDGIRRYYDPLGKGIEPAVKNSPLANYEQITEVPQRGRGKRRHSVDFKAATGTPIHMPFTGRVSVSIGRPHQWPLHRSHFSERQEKRFLHLHSVEQGVKPGRTLKAGAPGHRWLNREIRRSTPALRNIKPRGQSAQPAGYPRHQAIFCGGQSARWQVKRYREAFKNK